MFIDLVELCTYGLLYYPYVIDSWTFIVTELSNLYISFYRIARLPGTRMQRPESSDGTDMSFKALRRSTYHGWIDPLRLICPWLRLNNLIRNTCTILYLDADIDADE